MGGKVGTVRSVEKTEVDGGLGDGVTTEAQRAQRTAGENNKTLCGFPPKSERAS
jgi:hypothetical protein